MQAKLLLWNASYFWNCTVIYLDTGRKVCLRVQQRWQDLPSLPLTPCLAWTAKNRPSRQRALARVCAKAARGPQLGLDGPQGGHCTFDYSSPECILLLAVRAKFTPLYPFSSSAAQIRQLSDLDGMWSYFRIIASHGVSIGDGGDQELLIHYFALRGALVYELPVEYNAFVWELASSRWWLKVRPTQRTRASTFLRALTSTL